MGKGTNDQHAAKLSALAFKAQFARFKEQVVAQSGEEFASFREGLPAQWESYKGDVRQEALNRLAIYSWKRAQIGTGRILSRAISAVEINKPRVRNNLVDWEGRWGPNARDHRTFIEAQSDELMRKGFERWLFAFYTNRLDHEDAFGQIIELTGKRYSLIAYLYFLKDWNCYPPIRPKVFDRAFRLLDLDLVTSRHCSWDNYSCYTRGIA